jgi:hypothetical protein
MRDSASNVPLAAATAAICCALLCVGCGDDDCCTMVHYDAGVDLVLPQDANSLLHEVSLVPPTVNLDLDLLFVVDDSAGMLDKQRRLVESFAEFVNVLALPPLGGALTPTLPNLHLGVVTTDMGVKGADDAVPGTTVGTCVGAGKDGLLQTRDAPLTDLYLADVASGAGRITNYTGSVADAFAKMASVGDQGCALEQPLAAIQRALTSSANAGFLRSSARLAIIVMTDEDDCSFAHSTFLTTDPAELGPLGSFRCTRFGVTCDDGGLDPDQMNIPGTKARCHSNESSPWVTNVGRYAGFLRALKPDPRNVFVASIAGASSPFVVELATFGTSAGVGLAGSCAFEGENGPEVAAPPARLATLVESVPHGAVGNLCNDLATQLRELALRVRGLLGTSRCVHEPIALPATCEAVDIDASGVETVVPRCTAQSGPPCFEIVQDLTACPAVQSLKIEVTRSAPSAAGVWTSVRCAT